VNTSLQTFLDFWKEEPQNTIDPTARLYRAHQKHLQELLDLKAQGRIYIVPGKDSRGRWIPVFDDSRVDEIAVLASRINAASGKLESITNDIIKLVELAGGPSLAKIERELSDLQGQIGLAEARASQLFRKTQNSNLRMTPEQILDLPEVKEAYEGLKAIKTKNEPLIAALVEKESRLREIYERYP